MISKILSDIRFGYWHIEPQYAHAHFDLIRQIQDGKIDKKDFSEERERLRIKSYVMSEDGLVDEESSTLIQDSNPGSIAIVRMIGPITKYDQFCGPLGTKTIENELKQIDRNPNIGGVLLYADSGGGSADGPESLAKVIKGMSKPVLAFADGIMASAMYFISSTSTEIWANLKTDQIGSIGTVLSYINDKAYWDEMGIKFESIYATRSTEKNKVYRMINDGKDPKQEVLSELDPFNQNFIDFVASNRELDKNSDVFKGKLYSAEQALELGLIDNIGDIDQALARLNQLIIENNTKKQQTIQNQNNTNMKKFTAIASFFSVEAFESTEEGVYLNDEQLERLNEFVANNIEADTTHKNAVTTLEAERDQAKTSLTELEGAIETALSESEIEAEDETSSVEAIALLSAKVKELSAKPGADHKGAISNGDTEQTEQVSTVTTQYAERVLGKK